MQGLCTKYPTQEPCARSCRIHGSHPATRARSYRSYISYRSGIELSALKDLDHGVGTDDVPEVRNPYDTTITEDLSK